MRWAGVAVVAVLAVVGSAACSGSGTVHLATRRAPGSTTTSTEVATTVAAPSTSVPSMAAVATTVLRRVATTVARRPAAVAAPAGGGGGSPDAALLVTRLHGIGNAQQVISVTSSSWSSASATLQAFENDGGGWRTVVGPTPAFVGVNGFAADKQEGDGRTPAGVYGFQFMFGTAPSPGVRYTYRQTGPSDVWVDDPSSSLYNTWQEEPANGQWAHAEQLDQPGPYHEAAVIAYNTARVPGKGSAIFLHVSMGHGTAGCVAVAEPVLLTILRWLDPARQPVIAMGPQSYVAQS
ncbi:MAG: L,D-transpeptidase family protein [Acidimicrobiia bacterium]|nr:L,D-transpeptidase family protein [Acidimicrobiia bacterium]